MYLELMLRAKKVDRAMASTAQGSKIKRGFKNRLPEERSFIGFAACALLWKKRFFGGLSPAVRGSGCSAFGARFLKKRFFGGFSPEACVSACSAFWVRFLKKCFFGGFSSAGCSWGGSDLKGGDFSSGRFSAGGPPAGGFFAAWDLTYFVFMPSSSLNQIFRRTDLAGQAGACWTACKSFPARLCVRRKHKRSAKP